MRCEVIGNATLHLADWRDVPQALAGVAAIVSDPPYGIAYQRGSGGRGRHNKACTAPIHGDNEPFDPAPVLAAAPRVLLWGADHYRVRLPEGGSWLCWDKSCGVGPADSFNDAEFAWTSVEGVKRTVHRQLWKGVASRGADALGKSERFHVSQKPRELMHWCIGLLGLEPGSLICDPYMGSGSTGIAALEMGYRFVGVEIDPGHFATACRRLEAAATQAALFDHEPAPRAEQTALEGL